MNRLQQIQERQEAIRARLAEIKALPEPEGDEAVRAAFVTDLATETDTLLDEYDVLETEGKPLAVRAARLADLPAPTVRESGFGGGPEVVRKVDPYDDLDLVRSNRYDDDDIIGRAKAAIDGAPRHMSDAGRQHVTELLDEDGRQAPLIARHMLLTGSPEYHQEFERYVESFGRLMGPNLFRALSLSPDSAGGALVPFTLDPSIILTNLGIAAGIRNLATVKQITTDAWNGVTSDGVTAQWLAENTAAADATPTFAQPAIPVYKAFAYVVGSYEALADTGFAGELGRLIADAKARLDGAAFATGSGSGQPTGMITKAVSITASRVASAGATMAVADIFNVSNAASPRHAADAAWFANKSAFNAIRQFSTVTGGGTFWTDLGPGRPSQLLGASTYEESSMDTNKAGTTSTLLALVDPKSYYVIDRVGVTLKYNDMIMSTTTNTPLGQAGWAAFWRTGGDLVGSAAAARVYRQFTTTSGWV